MDVRTKAKKVLSILGKNLSRDYCALLYRTPFELAVATILSAQCTDKRVNQTTPALFAKFPTPEAMARASIENITHVIHSINFANSKAKYLKGMAEGLLERFDGEIPKTMKELTTLPGIARKTANVILIHGFGITEGIPVDTHVLRVTHRIGLTSTAKNATVTEKELMKLYPKKDWPMVTTSFIHHGRTVCFARTPACEVCPVAAYCSYFTHHKK